MSERGTRRGELRRGDPKTLTALVRASPGLLGRAKGLAQRLRGLVRRMSGLSRSASRLLRASHRVVVGASRLVRRAGRRVRGSKGLVNGASRRLFRRSLRRVLLGQRLVPCRDLAALSKKRRAKRGRGAGDGGVGGERRRGRQAHRERQVQVAVRVARRPNASRGVGSLSAGGAPESASSLVRDEARPRFASKTLLAASSSRALLARSSRNAWVTENRATERDARRDGGLSGVGKSPREGIGRRRLGLLRQSTQPFSEAALNSSLTPGQAPSARTAPSHIARRSPSETHAGMDDSDSHEERAAATSVPLVVGEHWRSASKEQWSEYVTILGLSNALEGDPASVGDERAQDEARRRIEAFKERELAGNAGRGEQRRSYASEKRARLAREQRARVRVGTEEAGERATEAAATRTRTSATTEVYDAGSAGVPHDDEQRGQRVLDTASSMPAPTSASAPSSSSGAAAVAAAVATAIAIATDDDDRHHDLDLPGCLGDESTTWNHPITTWLLSGDGTLSIKLDGARVAL